MSACIQSAGSDGEYSMASSERRSVLLQTFPITVGSIKHAEAMQAATVSANYMRSRDKHLEDLRLVMRRSGWAECVHRICANTYLLV